MWFLAMAARHFRLITSSNFEHSEKGRTYQMMDMEGLAVEIVPKNQQYNRKEDSPVDEVTGSLVVALSPTASATATMGNNRK